MREKTYDWQPRKFAVKAFSPVPLAPGAIPNRQIRPALLRVGGIFAAILLSVVVCPAEDVAIVWDISKSVPTELYSAPVFDAVQALVLGKGLASTWKVTLSVPAPPKLQDIIAGKDAMANHGDHVLVVHFGALHREKANNLPFLSTEFDLKSSPDNVDQLLRSFPKASTDDWTNKYLAEASAARYLYDRGTKSWFLIVISDFNEDNKELLLPNEREFADAYEAQIFANLSPPTVIRLEQNPRVIIKLRHAVSRIRETTNDKPLPDLTPKTPIDLISPANGSKLSSTRPISFSWRWLGQAPPDSYRLVVTRLDAPSGTVLSKSIKAASFTTDRTFDPGSYRWQIFAMLKGETVSSRALSFSVQATSGTGSVLLLILFLAGLAAILLYFNKRRHKELQQ